MKTGTCNCGAIAFQITAPVRDVYTCHCSICRRGSGAHAMTVLVIPKGDFRWTKGADTIRNWKKPGHRWETWFCGTCSCTVPGTNDPERMFVPVGLLEDQTALEVAHHLFTDSRAPWHVIGDEGVQHPEGFGAGRVTEG